MYWIWANDWANKKGQSSFKRNKMNLGVGIAQAAFLLEPPLDLIVFVGANAGSKCQLVDTKAYAGRVGFGGGFRLCRPS